MAKSWFLKLYKGLEFEETAVSYLKKKKYKLICRNYSCRYGEIDAIFHYDGGIVMFEIKGGKNIPPPYFRVNRAKLLRITKTIDFFLSENPGLDYSFIRVDVISVALPGPVISHFENVISEL